MCAYLVRAEHVLVEDLLRNLVDKRVSNPCAVVTIGNFAKLVGLDLVHRDFIRLRVAFNWDLRRHATHGSDFPPEFESQ